MSQRIQVSTERATVIVWPVFTLYDDVTSDNDTADTPAFATALLPETGTPLPEGSGTNGFSTNPMDDGYNSSDASDNYVVIGTLEYSSDEDSVGVKNEAMKDSKNRDEEPSDDNFENQASQEDSESGPNEVLHHETGLFIQKRNLGTGQKTNKTDPQGSAQKRKQGRKKRQARTQKRHGGKVKKLSKTTTDSRIKKAAHGDKSYKSYFKGAIEPFKGEARRSCRARKKVVYDGFVYPEKAINKIIVDEKKEFRKLSTKPNKVTMREELICFVSLDRSKLYT